MEIFGIGPAELILILVVAFLVLGPERMPQVARKLAGWLHQLRRLSGEFNGQLQNELGETVQDIQSIQQDIRDLPRQLAQPLQSELGEMKQAWQDTQQAMEQAGQAEPEPHPSGSEDRPSRPELVG